MALGGGVWFSQNKILPGTYINFISRATAAGALSERGVCAIALTLDWGADSGLIEVDVSDFLKNSQKIFGYDYGNAKMKGLRDLYLHARKVYVYKLNGATTGKATNAYATALYSGVRGNDLKIKVAVNADDEDLFDVTTLLGTAPVDVQTVASAAALKANDYVTFKTNATLEATAGLALTGGTNATVTVANHQAFLDLMESVSDVNAIGVVNDESVTGALELNALYGAWVKRMRDEVGVKLQLVAYNYAGDHEGIVNVVNATTDDGWSAASLVYWVLGVIGGTAINASATNMVYDGEFTVTAAYTQAQLEGIISGGKFALHKVGPDLRILMDINSLVTLSDEKNYLFQKNQTIRVIDNIATDIAAIFNTRYLGQVPNDDAGRISLWTDIVAHHRELERIRAIEDFDEDLVTVEPGDEKTSVLVNEQISVVNAMEKLYMTCVIS